MVLYKERNALLTYITKTKRKKEIPQTQAAKVRLRSVKESSARIKAVLGERRKSFKDARGAFKVEEPQM